MSVIIFRYVSKQILFSFFATTMVLLLIFVSNQFVHNLNDAASGRVTIHIVLMVTLVQLPILLSYMLPLGLFLSILLTFGRLYVDHEMVVLSACGVSKAQVIGMVMLLVLPITVIDAWLMLSVQPQMARVRAALINQAVQTATLDRILPGRFYEMGNDARIIYVGSVDKSIGHFGDVFVAMRQASDTHNAFQWTVLASDGLRQQATPAEGDFFVFENGTRYWGAAGEKELKQLHFKEFWQRLPRAKVSKQARYSAMPTQQLIQRYGSDLRAAAELQWRIVNVLATLLFALLAIPLSEVNPRKGKFAQMLPAILVYGVYANMMFAAKSWVETQKISVALGMWWILAALLLLAVFLLLDIKKYYHRFRREN